jgi:hypothetical protein
MTLLFDATGAGDPLGSVHFYCVGRCGSRRNASSQKPEASSQLVDIDYDSDFRRLS